MPEDKQAYLLWMNSDHDGTTVGNDEPSRRAQDIRYAIGTNLLDWVIFVTQHAIWVLGLKILRLTTIFM